MADTTQNDLVETEIGVIPRAWTIVRLGDMFDIQQGKSLSRKKNNGLSPRPFLRTSNVFWGRLDLAKIDQMDFSPDEVTKYALKPNDLLVCEGGDIGRTAIWQSDVGQYCYQNHLHRLRTRRDDIEPLFYMYWMQAGHLVLNLYQGTGNKTTIPNLLRSRLAEFPIPKPPLPEQRRIAHVLSTIQRAIQAQDTVIAAARELKRSLMHRLFTYGPYAEPLPTKETDFGEVPLSWQEVGLEHCAKVQTGVAKGRKLDGADTVDLPCCTS